MHEGAREAPRPGARPAQGHRNLELRQLLPPPRIPAGRPQAGIPLLPRVLLLPLEPQGPRHQRRHELVALGMGHGHVVLPLPLRQRREGKPRSRLVVQRSKPLGRARVRELLLRHEQCQYLLPVRQEIGHRGSLRLSLGRGRPLQHDQHRRHRLLGRGGLREVQMAPDQREGHQGEARRGSHRQARHDHHEGQGHRPARHRLAPLRLRRAP